MHVCMLNRFSHVQFFATLWTVACQATLSMGFSKQESCSGLPFSPLRDLPDLRIEPAYPVSPVLQEDSLPPNHWGRPTNYIHTHIVSHLLLLP